MMAKRDERRAVIRTIVRSENVRTQRDLGDKLQSMGYDCTQATVSRDVAEMGLLKSAQGFYMLPEDVVLERVLTDMVERVEDAGNLVIVKTRPGSASVVGEAIDNTEVDGLVGSVAGDNTIMIAAKNEEYALAITKRFQDMRRR